MRYLSFCFIFLTQIAQAQLSESQYLLNYKEAVQSYVTDDYESSIEKLIPLTSRVYKNDAVPYALYYFSLASLKANKAYQARGTLRDLMQRFPDWDKIEEAYYLYGYVNLKDNYFDEGLTYLDKITSKELAEKASHVKTKSFSGLKNIMLLKELNSKFPADRMIAQNLVKRIQEKPYNSKADIQLSDLLTNRFNLLPDEKPKLPETKPKSKPANKRSFEDETIDVGVLLPFELKIFMASEAAGVKRYVFDMFWGMQLAEQKLKSEGIKIKVYGFDVDKEATSAAAYLSDPNFKKLDVIVGPLYGKPNELVEKFAEKNETIQLHPISNNSALLGDSEIRLLIQASNISIVSAALDFAESRNRPKTISIFHDGSRDDQTLANTYATEATKRGYKVLENNEFTGVIESTESPGHIFFTCNKQTSGKLIRALGKNKMNNFTIATASSFDMETVSRGTLSKELYLINPQFANPETMAYQHFKTEYLEKMKAEPSYYAFLGYDMLLFYSRMLKDGKGIFRFNLNEKPAMDDLILSGFDYSDGRTDNKIVPIVRFTDGKFEIVNQ